MDAYLAGLATESISENTRDIDLCSTREMVEMMNREDARVAEAVHAECDHIAQAVDLIYGCLRRVKARGGVAIGLCTNAHTRLEEVCDVTVAPLVGPEVITGSTRLKSGTAQKMVLNMFTTCAMIKLGKVYGNLMVDVKPTNAKLVERCKCIVCEATGVDYDTATEALEKCGYRAKVAIVMLKTGSDVHEAEQRLEAHEGRVAQAVGEN